MRIFGLNISREKAAASAQPVDSRGTFWPIIREPYAGAWQKNDEKSVDTVLTNPIAFRCVSMISSDVAKIGLRLVRQDNGIWTVTDNPAWSPVLRKPNRYQNRIQFIENWILSRLTHGNTYVLKARDNRNVVTALYVLDPTRCKPLVAPDGSVYYQLMRDDLAGVPEELPVVPASEIIHDRINCVFNHPLVGVSPIYACGAAAVQGLAIQRNSTKFFSTGSRPGGVLTAPAHIPEETAKRIKEHWDTNYSGDNYGKIAVLGDGLGYQGLAVNATDSQLVEQLKWSAETICSVFGVPAYMAGVGAAPLNNNVEALQLQYYGQTLQTIIESIELCLDEGLELPKPYGTEFDLTDLIRMDTATKIRSTAEAVKGGIMSPNEGRARFDLPPVPGGDVPFLQEQNWPISHLAERPIPDREVTPPADTAPAEAEPEEPETTDEERAAMAEFFLRKELRALLAA